MCLEAKRSKTKDQRGISGKEDKDASLLPSKDYIPPEGTNNVLIHPHNEVGAMEAWILHLLMVGWSHCLYWDLLSGSGLLSTFLVAGYNALLPWDVLNPSDYPHPLHMVGSLEGLFFPLMLSGSMVIIVAPLGLRSLP
eukprot:Gb_00185 [translate_table: standard]